MQGYWVKDGYQNEFQLSDLFISVEFAVMSLILSPFHSHFKPKKLYIFNFMEVITNGNTVNLMKFKETGDIVSS